MDVKDGYEGRGREYHCSRHDVDLALLERLFSVCDELFAEHGKDAGESFDEGETHIGVKFWVPRLEILLFWVRHDSDGKGEEDGPRGSRVIRLRLLYLWDRLLRRPKGRVRQGDEMKSGYTMCNRRRFSSSLVPGNAAVSTQSKKRLCICDGVSEESKMSAYGPVLHLKSPS